ncbi:MAG: hydrogenase maturation protease [Phycisphaerales bacterium]|nr:hydrogenase maturation protease [Phycisphaerales bacterium]
MPLTPPILLIGCGSELRGDDVIGRRIAGIVAAWNLPDVQVLSVHQLTPELAEPISRAGTVIFVDAGIDPIACQSPVASGRVCLQSIVSNDVVGFSGHVSAPAALLALAGQLYGNTPAAYLLTVPTVHFELGADLSENAQRGIRAALDCLATLLGAGAHVETVV